MKVTIGTAELMPKQNVAFCDDDWEMRVKDCVPKSLRELADEFRERKEEEEFIKDLDLF